ncbi:MAG: insulinase family protein, partial [Thermoanaerobaculia bacterium]|nr:insulinase family protein [Thermoanaerobaculia bacterium]
TEMPEIELGEPEEIRGRHAIVIEEPNAPAAGIHIGFPLEINRSSPDFWPLYVAQTWFGTHRDSFGRLYQQIRQERGYNYGDYAYIEHWDGKPFNLFQIFNQPREQQYFSIWIRPVGHEYAYHLGKAATYELENLVRHGLTDEEVAEAKKKARVLYLNLAETVDRLLAAKMDDAFYGMTPGFLEGYLNRIDRVTTEEVNRAIRKHLQTENLKYVFITNDDHAEKLVEQIRENRPAYGKSLEEYELQKVTLDDGLEVWQVPESKLEMLREDALWANYPLNIELVRQVSVEKIFETGSFIAW